MKKIFNLLIMALSYAPIASISVAAHAKLGEMNGEDQSLILRKKLQTARSRLMPLGSRFSSIDQVIERSASITGLQGNDLEASVRADIELLIDHGILEIKENMLISGVPSAWGA